MKFILTIDTEGDNQWDYGRELTVENIKYIPRFQNLCDKFHIKPTYLVTSEVCEDPFAKELFTDYLSKNKAEIGAHLHSWTTPPFLDKEGFRFNDSNHGYATELPPSLLNEKITNLTYQIEASFGERPFSFRSGRYGFNEILAGILHDNSYLVDSSVTPYISWASHTGIPAGTGGPDFIDKTPFPYNYDFPGGSLLEIPITILPTRFPLNKSSAIASHFFTNVDHSIFLRGLRKLFFNKQPLWLRPNIWMNLRMFEEVVDESLAIKLPCMVMIFHSSELMPGCSIYRSDKESIEKLYEVLENLFMLLHNRNIDSVTLTEAAKTIKL